MKNLFEDPKLRVICFGVKDVLTESPVPGNNETPIKTEEETQP